MKRLSFFVFRYSLPLSIVALALITSGVSKQELLKSLVKVSGQLSAPETLNAPQSDTRYDRVEAEVITILSTGFYPSEITRPRGQFLILIDNRSDFDDLTLRLVSAAGPTLREVRQTKEEKIVKHLENLPPGEYLLTEASNPDWICRITIKPN